MSAPEHDPLIAQIRVTRERRARWLRDGDGSVTRRLAQIGVLGWITVIPMLVAIFAGRWLDTRFHTGIFWTAPLLMLGAGLGCWSAWRWVQSA
jgi:ATP synthase protein I